MENSKLEVSKKIYRIGLEFFIGVSAIVVTLLIVIVKLYYGEAYFIWWFYGIILPVTVIGLYLGFRNIMKAVNKVKKM